MYHHPIIRQAIVTEIRRDRERRLGLIARLIAARTAAPAAAAPRALAPVVPRPAAEPATGDRLKIA